MNWLTPAWRGSPAEAHQPAGLRARQAVLARCIPLRWIVIALTAAFGADQIFLWLFLGSIPAPLIAIGAALLVYLCVQFDRAMRGSNSPSVSVRTLVLLGAFAIALFILGGEGRLFYANYDWRIRDAVLRDMATSAWPVIYDDHGAELLLRAPLGMYFLPALAFKVFGPQAGDVVLLFQNSAFLAFILAAGSTLFETPRSKRVALVVITLFSGLDIIGSVIVRGKILDHMEWWSGLQFSSPVTLAFWAPNHALPAWCAAVLFALWRSGKAPLVAALAPVPMLALWSPFSVIGILPFAALAGVEAILRRKLTPEDIALPALATLIAMPSLLYLGAAGDTVGARPYDANPVLFGLAELLEALVFIVPLIFFARKSFLGAPVLALVATILLVTPFIQIGYSIDVMMRASIPALALLSIMVAEAAIKAPQPMRICLVVILAVGAATPLSEMKRAFAYPASPRAQCPFPQAWEETYPMYPLASYVARVDRTPPLIRPRANAKSTPINSNQQCWDRLWPKPKSF